jgi:hypothetical protein
MSELHRIPLVRDGADILVFEDDPNGRFGAITGTIGVDTTTPGLWQKTADGPTSWVFMSNIAADAANLEVEWVVLEGYGSALAAGAKAYMPFATDARIEGILLLADASGSAVVDIRKSTFTNFEPDAGSSIFSAGKPTLSSAQKYLDTTLTGVDRAIDSGTVLGDILCWVVDSASAVKSLLGAIIYSRQVGPVAPIQPDEIEGLALWLKADAISGLSDGDPVALWEDSWGNNDASQSASVQRPTYKTEQQNGLPVVEFDAANATSLSCLSFGLGGGGTQRTIIAVTKKTGSWVGSPGADRYWCLNDQDVSMVEGNGSNTAAAYYADAALGGVNFPAGNTSVWAVRSVRARSDDDATLFKNFEEGATFDPFSTYIVSENAIVHLGAQHDDGNPISAQFAEFIVYNRRISNREFRGVVSGLINKWGIVT